MKPLRPSVWLLLAVCAAAVLCAAAPAGAAETPGAEGPARNLGDLGHAIVTILIFLLLLVVLGRWAWKPLVNQLHRREEDVARTMSDTRKNQVEAEEMLAHYRHRLENAEAESERLLAEAREQAEEARRQVIAEAREEARKFSERARREIADARREAMADLHESAAELAVEAAGRIIDRELDEQTSRRMVVESLRDMKGSITRE